jgi:hypothetical protein
MILVWLCVSGCASESFDVDDARATRLDADLVTAAHAEWMSWGLPDPAACPVPREEIVTSEEFSSACNGRESCFEHATETCAWACTVHAETRDPVLVRVDAEVPADADEHTPDHERVHETYHVWSHCVLGTIDFDHSNGRIWVGAMRAFQ